MKKEESITTNYGTITIDYENRTYRIENSYGHIFDNGWFTVALRRGGDDDIVIHSEWFNESWVVNDITGVEPDFDCPHGYYIFNDDDDCAVCPYCGAFFTWHWESDVYNNGDRIITVQDRVIDEELGCKEVNLISLLVQAYTL